MTNNRLGSAATIIALVVLGASASQPQTPTSAAKTSSQETRLTNQASGPFDVKLTPQTVADQSADSTLGRMSIEKQFHGDLEATSKGEMLTVSTSVKGSGVYVAVELVTGTLQGRKGSFALHHTGIMTRGTPELKITVVPESGTDQLVGLSGTMAIQIDNGKHSYRFDYTLPESR
jgi:glucose/arabinose dehydrogenase